MPPNLSITTGTQGDPNCNTSAEFARARGSDHSHGQLATTAEGVIGGMGNLRRRRPRETSALFFASARDSDMQWARTLTSERSEIRYFFKIYSSNTPAALGQKNTITPLAHFNIFA